MCLSDSYRERTGRIRYSRDFLVNLRGYKRPLTELDILTSDRSIAGIFRNQSGYCKLKKERTRKRGRRGGVRRRLKQLQIHRIPLPSILLCNAQSIRNKLDELHADVIHQEKFRDACILAFTETWLTSADSESDLSLPGFGAPIRLDRDPDVTGKSQGGGVCIFVNQRWCSNITVKESLCTTDIELLSVAVRPYYLPREFPQVFLTVVYINPKANVKNAVAVIQKVTNSLQSLSPDAPCFVLGDFNHCDLKSMKTFYQYVSCSTRLNKTLDLCYGTIKGAYKCVALPPLGSSDHNSVLLTPIYRPLLKRGKVTVRKVEMWTDSAINELKGALELTDWDVFNSSDLDERTDAVTCYVNYLKDSIIPTREVKIFPNNKPWLNRAVKEALHRKHEAYLHGDTKEKAEANKEARSEIKKAKLQYKSKIEEKYQSNNLKAVWDGMKAMTGQRREQSRPISISGLSGSTDIANALNNFYLRFNDDVVLANNPFDALNEDVSSSDFTISVADVKTMFLKCNMRKSPGPDMITGTFLKICATQLCEVFSDIFNCSLTQHKIPSLWKESVVVPVAKTKAPKEPNDFRPVALTSLVMKCFERLVKQLLTNEVHEKLDPMQFAYRPKRGVEDATITLLHLVYKHLETPKTHARLLFADFSSAFNTIQPNILCSKLLSDFNLNSVLVKWIFDFLSCRPQRVKANGVFSERKVSYTGSPQGCVLSPLLYILYTNDCRSHHPDRHLIKFADDTVLVSLMQEGEVEHGPVISEFVEWCDSHSLKLNVLKTKELVLDFRKTSQSPPPTLIKGTAVEMVESYKYLGMVIDNRLIFDQNSSQICKKATQRLYFLRRLNSFNVDKRLMVLFYRSFIESILSFCLVSFYGNLSAQNKSSLTRIVAEAGRIIGQQQMSLTGIYERQVLNKALSVLSSSDHPLSVEFDLLPSGKRYRLPRTRTNRFKFSFVLRAINLLNLHNH